MEDVENLLKNVYQVENLLENDVEALKARVIYVHNTYNDQFLL